MPNLICQLDPDLLQALVARAEQHNRSLERELTVILRQALQDEEVEVEPNHEHFFKAERDE